MLCALVTEEIAEPGEGVMFCAILPVLPTLSVCSPDKASDWRSHDVVDDNGPPTSRRRIDLAHDCTTGVEKLSSPKR
jgi:hypothetical protein